MTFLSALILLCCISTSFAAIEYSCHNGWTYDSSGNSCLYVGRGTVSVMGADDACHDIDGFLADADSQYENELIKSVLVNVDGTGTGGAWTKDEYNNGDGWKDNSYSDWADPATVPQEEGYCKVMLPGSNWQWGAIKCDTSDREMLYVCQSYNRVVMKDCSFDGTCISLTQEFRSSPCSSGGGHLARLDSIEKNDFVKRFLDEAKALDDRDFDFRGHFIISGSDEASEGNWVYDNQVPMSFTNWNTADDQPDNSGRGESCVGIDPTNQNYLWDDIDCDGIYDSFLCEEEISNTLG